MSSILPLIRPDLQNFTPYRSARDEKNNGKIFLNANESPWQATPFLENVVLNRYPKKQPEELLPQLASLYQVTPEQLVMLRGSDEPIDLLTRLFCTAGQDAIMIATPTFGMYGICAKLQGVDIVEVPLLKANNYELDFDLLLSFWTPKVKIIFLCSPNNPTGNLLAPEKINQLCEQLSGKCVVVVDEAYIEFAPQQSMTNSIEQYANLAILRTFSKAFGLAGVRCGFLLAQAEMIDWIKRIAAPYPLSALTGAIISEALETERLQQVKLSTICLMAERERLLLALQAIPTIKKIWPSAGNFLLIEVEDADNYMRYCDEQGFVLRHMHHKPQLENCIRITVGSPEENTLLIKVLEEYQK